jgi:hypothetical protein
VIGLIQKLLLDMVQEEAGADAAAEVKRRSGLAPDFEFRLDTDYDDEQARQLLAHACAVLGIDEDATLERFARTFLRSALVHFPTFFTLAANSRAFLTRQPAIHNMLGSGLRNPQRLKAINDKFSITPHDDGCLEVRYRSPNRWCVLYRALAREVADHYGERLDIATLDCAKQGADACVFKLSWPDAGGDDESSPIA